MEICDISLQHNGSFRLKVSIKGFMYFGTFRLLARFSEDSHSKQKNHLAIFHTANQKAHGIFQTIFFYSQRRADHLLNGMHNNQRRVKIYQFIGLITLRLLLLFIH